MEGFKFGRAWSLGYRLVADNLLYQSILIIGLGAVLPLGVQFALTGSVTRSPSPFMNGNPMAMGALAAGGGAAIAITILTYVIQAGSYFASLRYGLAREKRLGGALLFGMPAGLMLILILGLAIAVSAVAFFQMIAQPGLALILGVVAALPVMIVLALFYTLFAAMVALGVSIVLLLMMAIGTATGNVGMAATLVGGSGAVAVALILLSAVLLWFAARLSCTTSVMAADKSFNFFAAARESWRLTWEEQWGIVRYLALVGFCMVAILVAATIAAGMGAVAMVQAGSAPQNAGVIGIIVGLVVVIPMMFLAVMIPVGIYRTLETSSDDAAIFA